MNVEILKSKAMPVFKWIRSFSLWLLFFGSITFFALGAWLFKLADEKLEYVLLRGKPESVTKDKAAGFAMENLVRYADEQNVPVYEFKGPYFRKTAGSHFSTYVICYKHPKHVFCYNHWAGGGLGGQGLDARAYTPGDKKTSDMEWLEQQPD